MSSFVSKKRFVYHIYNYIYLLQLRTVQIQTIHDSVRFTILTLSCISCGGEKWSAIWAFGCGRDHFLNLREW